MKVVKRNPPRSQMSGMNAGAQWVSAVAAKPAPRPLRDQCDFEPELASGGNNNIYERLEGFMEGQSSNPVAKQLISVPCILVEAFIYISNYTFNFFFLHPNLGLWGCQGVHTGADFCFC